jgi:hypothetical protein
MVLEAVHEPGKCRRKPAQRNQNQRGRSRRGRTGTGSPGTRRASDRIAKQCNRAGPRQGSPLKNCAGAERNGCQSQDVSRKRRGGSQGRRTPNLPEDVGSLGAVDENNVTARCGSQCARDLEDELSIGVTSRVERKCAGYAESGGGHINARR